MSTAKSHIDQQILVRVKDAYNLDTDADLADFLGIKQNTVATWKRRDSYNLELILSKCEDMSANWLIYGEKPIWKKDIHRNLNGVTTSRESQIPFYKSVKPAAGDQIIPEHEEDLIYIGLPRNFIYEELYSSPSDLFIMRVKGDSMEPTIGENDFVIVKQEIRRPYQGVYLLRIGEGLVCKRVEEHPDGLKIISDNPHYENYIVSYTHENLQVFGRVLWFGRTL